MGHRRLHSSSESLPLSSEMKPRISWERKPKTGKDRPRISWESQPWAVAASRDRPRISWDHNSITKPWVARVAPDRAPPGIKRALSGPARRSIHLAPIPLPPCGAPAPAGPRYCSPKKAPRREADPFLAAYIECTKSAKAPPPKASCGGFSCKNSCGVRDDGMVRLSQTTAAQQRERLLAKEVVVVKGRRSSFF